MDSGPERPKTRYWLRYQGNVIPLRESSVLIGRSAECDLVLDGELVSRRHVRVAVVNEGVFVEDLSANGVFLEGQRMPRRSVVGGPVEISVGNFRVAIVSDLEAGEIPRRSAITVDSRIDTLELPVDEIFGDVAIVSAPATFGEGAGTTTELTEHEIDQMIRSGQFGEVARAVSQQIEGMLAEGATRGRIEPLPAEAVTRAALRLADVSGAPQWVNSGFQLFSVTPEPMPVELVDEIYRLVQKGVRPDVAVVQGYIARIEATPNNATPRFVMMRLKNLERQLATR